MEVTVNDSQDITGVIQQVFVKQDFDVWDSALGMLDESDANYLKLSAPFGNRASATYGYYTQDMADAIDLLRVAKTQQDRVGAYKRISQIWVRDMPAAVITSIPQALLFSPKLQGLVKTGEGITLFNRAWVKSS
jgi:hypothetical protein